MTPEREADARVLLARPEQWHDPALGAIAEGLLYAIDAERAARVEAERQRDEARAALVEASARLGDYDLVRALGTRDAEQKYDALLDAVRQVPATLAAKTRAAIRREALLEAAAGLREATACAGISSTWNACQASIESWLRGLAAKERGE